MLRVFPLLECFLKFPKCSCNSRTREKRFFTMRVLILWIRNTLLFIRKNNVARRRVQRTISLDIY